MKKAVSRYDFYKIFMLVKVENSIFKHMKVVKLQFFWGAEWPLSSPPRPPHTHTAHLRTLTLHYTSQCSATELLFLCIRYMWNRNCHTQKQWRLPQFFWFVYSKTVERFLLKCSYALIHLFQGVHGGWKSWKSWKNAYFLQMGWKSWKS